MDDMQGLPERELETLRRESQQIVVPREDDSIPGEVPEASSEHGYIFDFHETARHDFRPYTQMGKLLFDKGERANVELLSMRNFLVQHRLFVTSKSPEVKRQNITHVTLNGLSFSITDKDGKTDRALLSEFYRLYAAALLKYDMFFVERPDKDCAMRFAADLDFKHVLLLRGRQVEAVIRVVQTRVMSRWFPRRASEDLVAIVCGAPYKHYEENGASMVKVGVHILWKNVFLSIPQMRMLRYAMVCTLESTFGRRNPPANEWVDVVDESIYEHSGLRMLGSYKLVKCPRCNDSKSAFTCEFCKGNGKVNDNRRYMPMFCLNGDGSRNLTMEQHYLREKNGLLDLVLDTVIRTDIPLSQATDEKVGLSPPSAAERPPEPAVVLEQQKQQREAPGSKRGKRRRTDSNREDPSAGGGVGSAGKRPKSRKGDMQPLRDGEVPYSRIEELVRSFSPEYKELLIKDVSATKDRSMIAVRVHGAGSCFCMNKGDFHRHNTVWFEVRKDGIRQRCFKRGDNRASSRNGQPCEDFTTAWKHIPPSVRRALFPTESDREPEGLTMTLVKSISRHSQSLGGGPIEPVLGVGRSLPARTCDGSALGLRGFDGCATVGCDDVHAIAESEQLRRRRGMTPAERMGETLRSSVTDATDVRHSREILKEYFDRIARGVARLGESQISDWRRTRDNRRLLEWCAAVE
jgi:hypothetical protein